MSLAVARRLVDKNRVLVPRACGTKPAKTVSFVEVKRRSVRREARVVEVLTVSPSKLRAAVQFCNASFSRSAFACQLLTLAYAANSSPGGIKLTTSKLVAAITRTSTVKAYASYNIARASMDSRMYTDSIAALMQSDAAVFALGLRCSHGRNTWCKNGQYSMRRTQQREYRKNKFALSSYQYR